MHQTCSWALYEGRLRRVTAYIHDHLDEDLDMERLAEIACLSPYHWHRIYRAVQGETLAQTVRRLRLQRAANALVSTAEPVIAIARQNGYPSLASFSRVFKTSYGLSPADYRKRGGHVAIKTAIGQGDMRMYDVEFRTMEPVKAIGVDHRGPYITIGKAFETLWGLLWARNLAEPGAKMYGVYYDDPEGVAPDQLRSAACVATSKPDMAVEAPLRPIAIAGGRYAVLTHKGPYSELHLAYTWLYGQWLPAANIEVRNEPAIEIYPNTPQDTAPQDLITEICIPVV
ncbi:AraC family transcriptional regulator [Gellertiella hungarica]|uniref:AraC family transcriptional regulator n=1 Tax=Gellertiella hungarica TaxID=1572859 RepID=A0A7W6J4I0_9HYPH|nr:AraC family transcriptional regulator [Gellertiella hungarica]MBB4064618.1 AraC family transcriptional regulator [Gellertiella hungarica]